MGRTTLGIFSGALVNAPARSFVESRSVLVGRYPVAPVIVYTGLLFIYSMVALGIFTWASSAESEPRTGGPSCQQKALVAAA